jgi:hypothetical protein
MEKFTLGDLLDALFEESINNKTLFKKLNKIIKENKDIFTYHNKIKNSEDKEQLNESFKNSNINVSKYDNFLSELDNLCVENKLEIKSNDKNFHIENILLKNDITTLKESFDFLLNKTKNNLLENLKAFTPEQKQTILNKRLLMLSEQLDGEDKLIFESYVKNDNSVRVDLFNALLSKAKEYVNEQIKGIEDLELKNVLLETKSKLIDMKFNEDTFISDYNGLKELMSDEV